ncbi:hypothetical protein QIH80_40615 [Bradyrhizobium elkanii]|nr:hypothetical protein QIH80_40615 [Bradyrhizobium elkanii]
MAIDATTSTRGTDDEYDLDIVAEIEGPDLGPEALLDDLEAALESYPVSKVVRQTRCITLYYADGMHLDITPSRRRAPKEKEGEIPHAKKGTRSDPARYVPMNSYAFGKWYCARTPTEERFALALNRQLYEQAGIAFAAADVEDVPPQTPLIIKSVTTVALQLIKRHRNIAYATETGRIPPSVMLSCHAGHAARPGMRLAEMLIRQARWTARAIDDAAKRGQLLVVPNPNFRSSVSPTVGQNLSCNRQPILATCTPSLTGSKPPAPATCSWRTCRSGCAGSSGTGSSRVLSKLSTSGSGAKFNHGSMVIRAPAACSFPPRRRSSARRPAWRQSRLAHTPTWESADKW